MRSMVLVRGMGVLKINTLVRFLGSCTLAGEERHTLMDISSLHDTELLEIFHKLDTHEQIATLLGTSRRTLVYHLYNNPSKYHKFSIPKKNGGHRMIMAPNPGLKYIQRHLAVILSRIYEPNEGAHGFIENRSIVTNAEIHKNRSFIINLDIKDFFPSITFEQVVDLFKNMPFQVSQRGATILARICCEDQQLPQGSPTSPVISNLICRRLDRDLIGFAEEHESKYSRYADDITISTNVSRVLPFIVDFDKSVVRVVLHEKLIQIIKENGFIVNNKKVRMQTHFTRQEVTGIIVNQRLNVTRKSIRQVRAMFHALEKFGPEMAKDHFFRYYDHKKRTLEGMPDFTTILRGKIEFIGMVRGKDDEIYKKFLDMYKQIHK